MKNTKEIRAPLVGKAEKDEAFRAHLVLPPRPKREVSELGGAADGGACEHKDPGFCHRSGSEDSSGAKVPRSMNWR